jgi:enterochelin esterase-like enzyme
MMRSKSRLSPLSAFVLVSVFALSLAGWTGTQVEIGSALGSDPSPQLGVRDRAAWQPSPVPLEQQSQPPAKNPVVSQEVAQKQGSPPASATTPAGEWREIAFFSRTLVRDMKYLVWLPPGFDATPSARYPTLYLLHGAGDGENFNRTEWQHLGVAGIVADLIARGEIKPMIVVLPEGEQGYWINHAAGGPRWADYVARDVVAHVDLTFPTERRPEKRAIGGLSMGGHGAAQIALNYPDVFRVMGLHSPSLRSYEQSPEFFGDREWFARYDPASLAQRREVTQRVTVWIDAGTRDRWRVDAEHLAKTLEAHGARQQFHVLDGGHDGDYWRAHLPRYIRFYAEALAGKPSKGL